MHLLRLGASSIEQHCFGSALRSKRQMMNENQQQKLL
jgi:hypothetical protein